MDLRANAIGIAVLLAAAACSEAAGREPAPPPAAPAVRTEVVSVTERSPTVRVTAAIQASRRATLAAETAGHVIDAPFRTGATVREGEVLLRLGGPRNAVAVTEARARIAQADAALRQATRAREQADALARENASTPNVVESARDRELEARARMAEAEAGLEAARAGLAETVLRAPFSGVLADFRVLEGDYVRPGTEVAVIVDPEGLEAELLLDPVEAADTEVGASVAVVARSRPDETFRGTVTFVGRVLDPRSRRLPLRVSIEDPERALRPGSVATFDVSVGPARPAVLVPEHSVQRRMGRTLVFTVEAEGSRAEGAGGPRTTTGVARAREVRVGEVRGGLAEVLEGLDAGDEVIVAGIERVIEGGPVRVVAEGEAADGEEP